MVPEQPFSHLPSSPSSPSVPESPRFSLALASLVLAAWVLLAAWQRSAYSVWLGHESLGIDAHGLHAAAPLAAFLLSWLLMTVAMMVPGSLPLLSAAVHVFQLPANRRPLAGWIVVSGYLAPWVLFGLLAYVGDSFLHELAEVGAPLAAYSVWIAPAILAVAGFYQLTRLKRLSIDRCRISNLLLRPPGSPQSDALAAWRQGLRLGVACLASCWPLMLLMFATGHNRLDWMLVLGGILAAERLSPWGHRLAVLVGGALIVWAACLVLA